MSDMDDVIDKIISKPVSVTTVKDGWIFAFDAAILQVLLKAANESETKKAIVFVTHEGNIH